MRPDPFAQTSEPEPHLPDYIERGSMSLEECNQVLQRWVTWGRKRVDDLARQLETETDKRDKSIADLRAKLNVQEEMSRQLEAVVKGNEAKEELRKKNSVQVYPVGTKVRVKDEQGPQQAEIVQASIHPLGRVSYLIVFWWDLKRHKLVVDHSEVTPLDDDVLPLPGSATCVITQP